MRIAVDLRSLLEPFESGVKVYTQEMVTEFLRLEKLGVGLKVDLFYQSRKRCERLHRQFPSVRHVKISTFIHRAKSVFGFRKLPDEYFAAKPDVIWLPDRREFYKTDVPVVMTIHDLVPEKYGKTLSFKGRVLHKIFSLKRSLKLCDGVLTPSYSTFVSVQKYMRKDKCVEKEVTYEGVNLALNETMPDLPKALKRNLKGGNLRSEFFLMISPADPRKRFDWVLDMACRFPKVNFVVAGMKGQDKRFSRVGGKSVTAEKIKKMPNLFVLGRVTESEKLWLLRHAKALLALSKYEGFDLPVLEAVTTKCPVILSNIAVHHELYHLDAACVVDDKTDLIAAISRMVSSSNSGKSCVPKPRGEYSWERAAARALLLFRRVVGNKNR